MKSKLAIAAVMALILLAGCAGTKVGLRSDSSASMRGSEPAPGASYSSAVIHAELSPNAYFGLLFFGLFAAGAEDDYLNGSHGPGGRKPPQLAEDRAIAERDCTKPLEPIGANLRCK